MHVRQTKTLVQPENVLREDQVRHAFELGRKDIIDKLPVSLRGRVKVWSLASLRAHCLGRARGLGVNAPTAGTHAIALTNGDGDDEVPNSILALMNGEEDVAMEEPLVNIVSMTLRHWK